MPEEISIAKKRGRPRGALNKKTRALLAQAAMEGITPLQVQLKNMRRWDRRAIALEIRAKALEERYRERSLAMLERAEDFRLTFARVCCRRAPVCPSSARPSQVPSQGPVDC
jgi:hypothetical protein